MNPEEMVVFINSIITEGLTFVRQGSNKEAFDRFLRAVKLNQNLQNEVVWYYLAILGENQGFLEEDLRWCLNKALSINGYHHESRKCLLKLDNGLKINERYAYGLPPAREHDDSVVTAEYSVIQDESTHETALTVIKPENKDAVPYQWTPEPKAPTILDLDKDRFYDAQLAKQQEADKAFIDRLIETTERSINPKHTKVSKGFLFQKR